MDACCFASARGWFVLLSAKVRRIEIICKSIVFFVVISLFIAARKIGTRGGRNDISTVIRTAAVGREMSDNIRHNRQNENRLDKTMSGCYPDRYMDTHDEKKYRDARLSADWGWTEIWGWETII